MMGSHRLRLILITTFAAVVLGVASTAALVAVVGRPTRPIADAPPSSCAMPALTGSVVDVTLTDVGRMMRPGMMGNWQNGYRWPGMGMQRIFLVPSTVPAAPVSLRVHNTGALTHEVLVLPLGSGQYPGQRAIGTNGRVDETGSLGEASRTCGADAGDGILADSKAWTTINLPPGRYELLCNIAGHYGAGMYAELDVVANR